MITHAQLASRQTTHSSPTPALQSSNAGGEHVTTPISNSYHRAGPGMNNGVRDGTARGRPLASPPATFGDTIRSASVQPINQDVGSDRVTGSAGLDTGLQRRTSSNYGHHRQTSVIHGIQHSRNTSFNSSLSPNSLSPESLPNVGLRNGLAPRRPPVTSSESNSSYSPSNSQDTTNTPSSSIDSTLDFEFDRSQPEILSTNQQRLAPPRMRRGGGHVPSSSRDGELKTPGEYAMHHLFNSFVTRADQKINQILANIDNSSTPVEQACAKGADPSFDQVLSALGHVSRQNPKVLVDTLMFWRQAKSESLSQFKKQIQQQHHPIGTSPATHIGLPRRHTEPLHGLLEGQQSPQSKAQAEETMSDELQLLERQTAVSNFILCRGLIEVFEQSNITSITPELAVKLEDIVFTQLKNSDTFHMNGSNLKIANWKIYAQVMGTMANVDFARITHLHLQQLGTWQHEIASGSGTTTARDLESRIELLLLSLQYFRLPTADSLSGQICDFLRALAQLFIDSHGQRVKQAYCVAFEWLLLPLSENADRFKGMPKFRDFLDCTGPRVNQMLTKPRHVNHALPLSALLLCLAPIESFTSQMPTTLNSIAARYLKENTRTSAMRTISQLTWSYLRRSQDSLLVRGRKVDDIIRQILPIGKKPFVSFEPSFIEAVLSLIRIVGFDFPDTCFKNIIFPLMNSDMVTSAKDLRIEQLEPEKITLGIKAFLAVTADLEKGFSGRPDFPRFSTKIPIYEMAPGSPLPHRTLPPPELLAPNRPPGTKSSSSLPVNLQFLDEASKGHYFHFCEILDRITVLCDNAFGSSAVLNEKFSGLTPKTPLVDAFNLNKREETMVADHKQSYYDLLHVAIEALPRCISDHVHLNPLLNLLCTGSAHVQSDIAHAAAQSLKAIAKQGYAQSVATAYPRFIFQYDSQYSTMSDEGRLGPAHIETTLTLYLELLQIWMDQIKQKAKNTLAESRDRAVSNATRAHQMEMTNTMPLVDEIEGYGLFFLCSQSRRVRSFAGKVLTLVLQFDEVLGKHEQSRVIRVLESNAEQILNIKADSLSVAERTRLEKDRRRQDSRNILLELSSSDNTYDATLWFKIFSNLIRYIFEFCPSAIMLSRGIVCDRLSLMQDDVERFVTGFPGAHDLRLLGRSAATPVEVFFDQWKLYLIMACVTLSSPGAQSQSQLAQAAHSRKTSRNTANIRERFKSARSLFSAVIPMLGAGHESLRSAVVIALGSINPKLYRTLLDSLQYAVITCNDEAKARIVTHQRTPSSPSRTQMTERMRTEVTHIYKLTAAFLRDDELLNNEWILNNLSNYTRDLRIFLSDAEVQSDWRFARLRYHYCGLVEELYENAKRSSNPSRWVPFEARKSAFTLMEEWCGYSSDHTPNLRGEEGMVDKYLTAAVEKEKSNLRFAALSAMATLCAGPLSVFTETNTVLQFNLPRMLSWIDAIFSMSMERMYVVGQRALKSLMLYNPSQSHIMEHAIHCCYGARGSNAQECCFSVIAEILIEHPDFPVSLTKVFGAVIFTLGHNRRDIRVKSAQLLRILDDRQEKGSNLQEFDISISDKTRIVYKTAQFEYSRRLAQAHPELAFLVFSEFCLQFRKASTDIQRAMIAAILPWVQTLNLQLDPATNSPTALTHMLLANMIEITARFGHGLHNEIQALWQALATGPYGGNVQLIMDFVINLCLERKEQNFVEFAKQIVVHLSVTPAGARILEFLLMQLIPKNMSNERKQPETMPPDTSNLPYTVDLATVLPAGPNKATLSLGQISLILLVDLLVPPVTLTQEHALRLMHVVFVLWDHYIPTVQEQAREMLVHLIHSLVTTRLRDSLTSQKLHLIEQFVENIRKNQSTTTWTYEDFMGKDDYSPDSNRVPAGMAHLATQVVDMFELAYDNFSDLWAKEALQWASTCPVKHQACRSFQVFRCISTHLDPTMLSDMLSRLSNTISDEQTDYQTFSLEILTTLRVNIAALDAKGLLKYPSLFWTTVACLNTIHEREFFESLGMLECYIAQVSLSDQAVIDTLLSGKPTNWDGQFEGVQPLIYKGLRSVDCLERTIKVMNELDKIVDGELVGSSDRLLFSILANLPILLHEFQSEEKTEGARDYSITMAKVYRNHGHDTLATCLQSYSDGTCATEQQFLTSILQGVQYSFFPTYDAASLVFVIGLLTNQTNWFRGKLLDVLERLLPLVDMRDPSITSHGPDLISPLLRLLSTDLCGQALLVMDNIIELSCTPLDKHHLRMSMTSGAARAIRKEYERTKSLYGIPESSGWSVPVPAVVSASTRANVHAVFYTCCDAELRAEASETPEVEFNPEEDSYFPEQSRPETLRSVETATDTNMGDLVNTLDSLDDFFDEPDSATTPTVGESQHSAHYYTNGMDHDTSIYDEHTAPILSRSLHRTSSSINFQNSLSETRQYGGHFRNQPSFSSHMLSSQNSFMSIDEVSGPGPSLTSSSRRGPPPVSTNTIPRPGLHTRSVTSPANQYPASQPSSALHAPPLPTISSLASPSQSSSFSDDLSDSESTPFPMLTPSTSHPGTSQPYHSPIYAQTPISATDTSAGFMRRGMRRLTGGKSESAKEKARMRGMSGGQTQLVGGAPSQSPRMPRIPTEYLGGQPGTNMNNGQTPGPLSP